MGKKYSETFKRRAIEKALTRSADVICNSFDLI